MDFVFNGQELHTRLLAEQPCWLLTNGLGGYASTSAAFSVTRNDQGLLVAAKTPNQRFNLVHRLSETLEQGGGRAFLSTQTFGDAAQPEEGYRHLVTFAWQDVPCWLYRVGDVQVRRQCGMAHGANTVAVVYSIENCSALPCSLRVTPVLQFAPKGNPPQVSQELTFDGCKVQSKDLTVYIQANVPLEKTSIAWQTLFYADDQKDGRAATGLGMTCCAACLQVPAGQTARLELVFSTEPCTQTGAHILQACQARQSWLLKHSGFKSPEAQELARSADAFIAYRASTQGQTILAGYPFFGDWGRDTMIALPGCVLEPGRYDTAKSILRTFLAYERDGLVPNLFPEGEEQPEYNSVDAPLLLINCVWLYYQRKSDTDFVREAWPVLVRIVEAYKRGTHYAIGMDADGLIRAGKDLDQVTWMDVRVDQILPTPRHGKPVEVNAYWYNALCILARLASLVGEDGAPYKTLAEKVKHSFIQKFWRADAGCLKDVLSGTRADDQIRCNQIWAVTMPFTMLSPEQERRVTDTVGRYLYTPYGLRTLAPQDPEFHPFYGGLQKDRDLAYHQGTIWPYPLGAYYLACLKTRGNTPQAAAEVRTLLCNMKALLREGCVGQLPEIYDGGKPGPSKGCFAQAWSVGELLRVYKKLEEIEEAAHA